MLVHKPITFTVRHSLSHLSVTVLIVRHKYHLTKKQIQPITKQSVTPFLTDFQRTVTDIESEAKAPGCCDGQL